jgi:hypothetical protein
MKKIIAIALALVLCTCMMSIAASAANTVTVHAQVPADWAEVGAYTWEPESLGGWPGTAMTKNGDWYEVEMGDAQLKLIINNNNNGKQTADLNIEAGKEIWVIVADDLSAQIFYEDPANGGEPVTPPAPETPTIPEDASFYVAGVGALCGEDWNPGAEANKMAIGSDGQYEKTFENVPAGEYALKVTIGNWDQSWGGDGENGNYVFTMEEAGRVTVLFNADTQTVSVLVNGEADAPAEKPEEKPEAPADATYIVAGVGALCGAEWDPSAEANKMSIGSDGQYTLTYKNVPAGSYALKVTNGTWDQSWGGDGADGNYEFTVAEAGDVVVKFDAANQKVSVIVNGVEDEPSQTGDVSLAAVSVALLAATAGLVAIVSKKEEI